MKRIRVNVSVAIVLIALAGAPGAAGAGTTSGDPVKGAAIYAAQKCNVCHKIDGKGGPMGTDLSAVGLRRDAAWLAKYLPNPTVLDPKNPPKVKMTPAKVKGQDLDDLISYLLTLKVKK